MPDSADFDGERQGYLALDLALTATMLVLHARGGDALPFPNLLYRAICCRP